MTDCIERAMAWRPSPEPEFPVPPSSRELLAGTNCPSWLEEAISYRLSCHRPVMVLAGLGLAARLAMPIPRRGGGLTEVLEKAESGPAVIVKRWIAGLEPRAIEFVEDCAVHRALRINDDLEEFRQLLSENRAEGLRAVKKWLEDRDDLESISTVLLPEAGAQLKIFLKETDRHAEEEMDVFTSVKELISDDDRLCAVGTLEPWCWWGDLAKF